jgi:O-antigen/teichoic acid export membrane protein
MQKQLLAEHAANTTGAGLVVFAALTAAISTHHNWALYAAIGGAGAAALILGLFLGKRQQGEGHTCRRQ